ncbi:MAG TPA: hypothetical protein VMF06_15390 [Candidatus Limnocylindria bacterium]|nr:hypothetical protein [Candidatus Limnocylindria bacterium]
MKPVFPFLTSLACCLSLHAQSIPPGSPPTDANPPSYSSQYVRSAAQVIGSNGSRSLMAWLDSRTGTPQVYCSPMSLEGELLKPDGTGLTQIAGGARTLSIASNGKDFLLVWESLNTFSTVYALRVREDGTPIDAAPLKVMTSPDQSDTLPAVASNGTDYFIAWQRKQTVDGRNDIHARRLLADGTFPDTTPTVLAGGPNEQSQPTVAGFSGGYLVAWSEPSPGGEASVGVITGARLDPNGARLDTNNIVLSPTPGPDRSPVAISNGKNFLVAWQHVDEQSHVHLAATRIGLTGPPLDQPSLSTGEEITAELQLSLASDGNRFLVLWQKVPLVVTQLGQTVEGAFIGGNGEFERLQAGLFAPNGTKETFPSASFDGLAYNICWTQYSSAGNSVPVGYRLTRDGRPATRGRLPTVRRLVHESLPAATATPDGFLTVWSDDSLGIASRNTLRATRFNHAAQPLFTSRPVAVRPYPPTYIGLSSLGPLTLMTWIEPTPGSILYPTYGTVLNTNGFSVGDGPQVLFPNGRTINMKIAAGTNGWLLVDLAPVGLSPNIQYQVQGFLIGWDGKLTQTNGIPISKPLSQSVIGAPAASFNGSDYLVAWSQGNSTSDILGARLAPDGTVRDPGGRVLSTTFDRIKRSPAVGSDGTNFFVAWEEKSPSANDFNTRGTVVTPEMQALNTNGVILGTGSNQQRPSVAFNGSHYLVTWDQARSSGLFPAAALLNPDGSIVRAQRPLAGLETSDQSRAIAMGNPGTFPVVFWWQSTNQETRVRYVHLADANPIVHVATVAPTVVTGGLPSMIAPEAQLIDAFDTDFNGGTIDLANISPPPSQTVLSIQPDSTPGQIVKVDGNVISTGDSPMAEFTATSQSIHIRFIAPTPLLVVQRVLRRLAIQIPSLPAGTDFPPIKVTLGVANTAGQASPLATISIPIATMPTAASEFQNLVVTAGTRVNLGINGSGGALKYRWQINGVPISGATFSSYSLLSPLESHSGDYSVVVSNEAGSVTNLVAHLTVLPNLPDITTAPKGKSVVVGENAYLRVVAEANLKLSYQWQHAGTNIPGAISPFLRLPGVSAADAGDYRVTVSNPSGNATSDTVRLDVRPDTSSPHLLGAHTWGHEATTVLRFDKPLDRAWTRNNAVFTYTPDLPVLKAAIDPVDPRLVVVTTSNYVAGVPYAVSAANVIDSSGNPLVDSTPVPLEQYVVNQSLLGERVPGFQDDFISEERDPRWRAFGTGGDFYNQHDGLLSFDAMDGDPNHLLFVSPAYNPEEQDVLARVRIVSMEIGDGPRGGIATVVDSPTSRGINLVARHENVLDRSFKELNDLTAWNAGPTNTWQAGEWFWLRLHREPIDNTQSAYASSKAWPADGVTPEPTEWTQWQYNRSLSPTQTLAAYAGITGPSNGGQCQMDIDYILISADGLPDIKVVPSAFVPGFHFSSIDAAGNLNFYVYGLAGAVVAIETSPDLVTWSSTTTSIRVGNDPGPLTLPAPEGAARFYRAVIR